MSKPIFSVVTPTYNRASLIGRVFDSLIQQSFKSFEWIVIDDGSTDDTYKVISNYKEKADFPINYVKTTNKGKVAALNTSLSYCSGFFYLVLDSDDWCDRNALQVFYDEWQKLNDKDNYFALSCLKRDTKGEIVGEDYSSISKYDQNYIHRSNLNITGDKWECLIFNKISNMKYPLQSKDKYMAPSYLYYKLSQQYNVVFINKPLSTVEYQPDGLSANNLSIRIRNSETTAYYYQEILKIKGFSIKKKLLNQINYYRFKLHSNAFESTQLSYIVTPAFYVGLIMYYRDLKKLS